MQHERGKVIGVGVCVYIAMFVDESYSSNRLTFSNIRGKTSCKIYRQALLLLSPEKFSSLSKFLFNVHCVLSISKMTLELYLARAPSPLAEQTTSMIIAELGRNGNVRSSA